MIFASVGSMFPFDRLVQGVDEWASENRDTQVFIQTGSGSYIPKFCDFRKIVPIKEYVELLQRCQLFVAHVGIGSIIQAQSLGKQMLLVPRRHSLGEHTTDHQMQSASHLQDRLGLRIAIDIPDMKVAMSKMLADPIEINSKIAEYASPKLIEGIRSFLLNGISNRER